MPDGTTTIPFPNLAANEGPIENTEQISNYESGEVEYMHQFAGGFNMDANYTFARCWSDTQGGQQNEGGPANGRAPWIVASAVTAPTTISARLRATSSSSGRVWLAFR